MKLKIFCPVACFLHGRAKDSSATLYETDFYVCMSCWRHWYIPDLTKPAKLGVLSCTPWQVGRLGWKRGVLERHLLTRVSWHFAFLTTDGKSAVNNAVASSQPITDLYS